MYYQKYLTAIIMFSCITLMTCQSMDRHHYSAQRRSEHAMNKLIRHQTRKFYHPTQIIPIQQPYLQQPYQSVLSPQQWQDLYNRCHSPHFYAQNVPLDEGKDQSDLTCADPHNNYAFERFFNDLSKQELNTASTLLKQEQLALQRRELELQKEELACKMILVNVQKAREASLAGSNQTSPRSSTSSASITYYHNLTQSNDR